MPTDFASAFSVGSALTVVAGLAVVALLGGLSRAAVRRSLANGLRCLGRYADFWHLPALFAVGYALFQLAAFALFYWRLGEPPPLVEWPAAPTAADLVAHAWLPAAECTAAGLTLFTATFPLSAWFAFRFLINSDGLLGELSRALRRRFGALPSALLVLGCSLSALAAIAKPAVYLFLPETLRLVPVAAVLAVNALGTAFELLLGLFFLTDLMLMAHAWLRGLSFDRQNLRRLAMRRTGYVVPWSFVIFALTLAFILLPTAAGFLLAPGDPLAASAEWFAAWIGRPLVVAIAISCAPVPVTLALHNASLRAACADARRLWARSAGVLLPFLVAAYAAFLALELGADYAAARFGGETLAALGSRIVAAMLEAFLTGWLIASWVCLYKSVAASRKEHPL